MNMQTLSLADFPLQGTRLIEASAGTGKTWTIAGLYLRLLLEKNLNVTQILVVTFTEAATQELRGRIRARIRDALAVLEDRLDDEMLSRSLAVYRNKPDAVQQLQDALTRMDEAAIYTIHGFCQRMLNDSAFESGALFDVEFVTDVSDLYERAISDFWRLNVVQGDQELVSRVLSNWKAPDELLKAIKPLLLHDEVRILAQGASVESVAQEYKEAFQVFVSQWREQAGEVMTLLLKDPVLQRNKDTWKKNNLKELEMQLESLLSGDAGVKLPDRFDLLSRGFIQNTENLLASKLDKGLSAPDHPIFGLAERLSQLDSDYQSSVRNSFLLEAADYINQEVTRLKRERRVLFFDDLLDRLYHALRGSKGERLAARIRTLHPVAMIDEFQDTDPRQYAIFNDVWGAHQANNETGLFMIGDPKQAIYSFRGADIFTYMQARRNTDATHDHFTLDANYRSAGNVVASVNSLFGAAQHPPFLYPDDIDYQPVIAAGNADQEPFTIDGNPVTPLHCWYVKQDSPELKGNASEVNARVAKACASDIAGLLNRGLQKEALIGDRPVVAGDVAVLVRDRFQAEAIRSALNEAGIASVFISRDSVFATDEALDFARVIAAVTEPGKKQVIFTALATRLFGYRADEIYQLHDEVVKQDALVQDFQRYQQLWLQEGFMPMFSQLLHEQNIPQRLIRDADGERRLTNLLQLAELAQQVSQNNPGLEGVLHWLDQARRNPDGDSEEQQLRMESDEHLVQIVTVHKSKGLQYNLVYLPFVWSCREETGKIGNTKKNKAVLLAHEEPSRELVADLGSEHRGRILALAKKERLAEDLRLLYVALTRARYRNIFCWGAFKKAEHSALAYLLHPPQSYEPGGKVSRLGDIDDEVILGDMNRLNDSGNLLDIVDLPDSSIRFDVSSAKAEAIPVLRFKGDASRRWTMTSFSGLSYSAHAASWKIDLPDHDQLVAAREQETQVVLQESAFGFPRGANVGLFLHQVLERIDFTGASNNEMSQTIEQGLEQYGLDQHWQNTVEKWMLCVLNTPLMDELKLSDIHACQKLVEMEFHFPLAQLQSRQLNTLLGKYRGTDGGQAQLEFNRLSGMMKGFVDLIVEHRGRYYVLDYKSNHLGNRVEDYTPDKLKLSITSHYYDLQFLIYLVALHRYLQQRLENYSYDTHMGGACYLYLRGMDPENEGSTGVYFDKPPQAVIEQLDTLFRGGSK